MASKILFIQHNSGNLNHLNFEEILNLLPQGQNFYQIVKLHQPTIIKEAFRNVSAATLLFLFVLFGFFSCKKDIGLDPDNPFNAAAHDRTEGDPTVTHSMLHFDSFADLSAFTQSLQDKEADTTQVRSAYTTLGINVNDETIPNLTDYPVCLLKEQAIGGYISARKAEEMVINTALDNGDDNIHSVVIFPYWKTALNADRAVHVGNRIYKYYENGGIAIVLNNDWTLYNTVKSQTFESLRESFNLIVTSDAREDWDHYFTFNTDESMNAEKKISIPRFTSAQGNDGKFTIGNISLVESTAGPATFKWVYSDNTSSTGQNPDRTMNPNEILKVIVDNGSGPNDTLNVMSPLVCSVNDFTITYLSNGQIRFELPGYIPGAPGNTYNLKWVFSDNTTSTANPVVKTFTSNGTATCQFLFKNSGEVACQSIKSFVIKCGDKKDHPSTFIFDLGSQRWKLDGSIWVQNAQVGCKVKYLRWRGVILGWKPAHNQAACANLTGTYIREQNTPTGRSCVDVTASGGYCLGSGTFPTSVAHIITEVPAVFNKPGQLSAGLGIQVNGAWRGWGYAGKPRLVLP